MFSLLKYIGHQFCFSWSINLIPMNSDRSILIEKLDLYTYRFNIKLFWNILLNINNNFDFFITINIRFGLKQLELLTEKHNILLLTNTKAVYLLSFNVRIWAGDGRLICGSELIGRNWLYNYSISWINFPNLIMTILGTDKNFSARSLTSLQIMHYWMFQASTLHVWVARISMNDSLSVNNDTCSNVYNRSGWDKTLEHYKTDFEYDSCVETKRLRQTWYDDRLSLQKKTTNYHCLRTAEWPPSGVWIGTMFVFYTFFAKKL